MVCTATKIFKSCLAETDPLISGMIKKEIERQRNQVNLIASENLVSRAVLEALSNVGTNKYAEGYPSKRYYGGCEYVDEMEDLAIKRATQLFGCEYANVQPHSGSQANQAVFLAFLKPGDTILGMNLNAGGHLTHGAAPNLSGKWFNAIQYEVDKKTGLLDYDIIADIAKKNSPKLLIAGASAYARKIDFKIMKQIADSVGALLLADIAHYSGLIAANQYPSPFPYADIVTTTTHKTLRGPRGGMILSNNQDYIKKINSAIFPGLQGGPIMNIIAAKAVCFAEALHSDFKLYTKQVIKNAHILAETIKNRGYKIVTDGTDSHMILVDLTDKEITGKDAERMLERVGIICNKNTVPNETRSPFVTSGIRLGTPAGTTRGFNVIEFEKIGYLVCDILESLKTDEANIAKVQQATFSQAQDLCHIFPIY
ncbi:MAG: serine hydroxymethyltransferase [Rickettsiales bacterium]|nr:serine hydroxymethyltransferase [Rickettsiales bacterium]